jgi:uncharacterized cofD-like protein
MNHTREKRIVTIGGGTGQFALLSGLRDLQGIEVTAVVSMVDSGGSTGRLRDELGILPPGDVLKCILALSPHRDVARTLLLKRFSQDRRLRGHNAGNMLLTTLSRYTGSFPRGAQALAEILDAKGAILPVTTDSATLVAELTDGSRIFGEEAIDIPRGTQRERIREVFLVPHHSESISVYPPVLEAISRADAILVGPGDLFTSIVPNLVVPGVSPALRETRARLLYVVNIMTKFGETHGFSGPDFVQTLETLLDRRFDMVIHNARQPAQDVLEMYAQQKADFVAFDAEDPFWSERTVMPSDLLDTTGGVVRHHARKLAALLQGIFDSIPSSGE